MTRSPKAPRVGSSFHLGTAELSSCVIVTTSHWIEVSVDQDLSVIVAEAITEYDVKQRLVPIVFTRA